MATNASSSPVEREVPAGDNPRDYIVRVTAAGLYIREKGRRTTYGPVSWDWIFQKSVEQFIRSQVLEARTDMEKRRRPKRVSRGLLTT